MVDAISHDHRSVDAEDESTEIALGQSMSFTQYLPIDGYLGNRPEAWPGMIAVKARFRLVL